MEFDLNSLMRPRRICLCKNVTKEDLQNAYHDGAYTLEELLKKTGAASGCTSCFDEVKKIYDELAQRYPKPSSATISSKNNQQPLLPVDEEKDG